MGQISRNLSLWSWAILLLILPFAFLPSIFLGFALFLILFLVAVRRWAYGHFLPPTPLNLALLLLLGSLLLSSLVMFDGSLSLPKLTGIVIGIALYFSVVQYSKERSLWPIVITYLFFGVSIAMVGLFGTEWPSPFTFLNTASELLPLKRLGIPGTAAGVINLNELAGVLCWVAPLLLAFSIGLRRRLIHQSLVLYVLLLAGTLFTIFLLFATSSRGGIFAFSVGALLIAALNVTNKWKMALGFVPILAMIIILIFFRNQADNDIVGDALGLTGRVEIWSRALLVLQDFPLTGVSVNGFRQVVHELYALFEISGDVDIAHAHNHLLQVGLDLGLPGMISYLALWILSGGLLLATLRNLIHRGGNHHPYYILAVGLAGSLLAGWVFGVFDTVALGARPGFMWWLLIGMTVAVHYEVCFSGKHLRVYRRVRRDRLSKRVQGDDSHASTGPDLPGQSA